MTRLQVRPRKNHWRLVFVHLLVVAMAPSIDSADWTTYRHDRERSGSTSERLDSALELRWGLHSAAAPRTAWSEAQGRLMERHEIRSRVDFDAAIGLVVGKGMAVLGSPVDHRVRCVEVATGKELWSFYTAAPVRLAPTIWQDHVLFGSDDGYAYCVGLSDGALRWKLRAGPTDDWLIARGELISRWPVRTGVHVEDGVAYFGAGIFPHEDVQLYAVDAATSKIHWRRDDISAMDAGRNDLSPQGYLLVTDELLFVPSGRSLPAAIERTTGKIVHKRVHGWRSDAGGVVGGTNAIIADGQIYSVGAHHAVALEQKTGDVGFGWFAGRRMAIAGETAYAATGTEVLRIHREVYAVFSREKHGLELELRDASGKLRKAKREKAKDDELAKLQTSVDATKSKLEALPARGILWRVPCDLDAELIVTADSVIVGGAGEVAVFNASTGSERQRLEVNGEARQLAVASECLFVSTDQGAVYCFGARKKPPEADDATPKEDTPDAAEVVQVDANAAEPKKEQEAPAAVHPFPTDEWTPRYEAAAAEILKESGVTRGFCLILGSENGRLAYELARQSDLKIYGTERDADKVKASRQALTAAGLYGHRVTFHQADGGPLPYSNYFANLVVSDTLMMTGELPPLHDLAHHLKPCGGVLLLGKPAGAAGKAISHAALAASVQNLGLGEPTSVGGSAWVKLTRGELPGAGDWSHQYGEPGNTACSEDTRIKGGLGVLWYGDPGPGKMVNRHEGAVGPVCTNGRFFIQGETSLLAHDAYNGLFLWERENPTALRTGVFRNENPANLVATDDSVFYLVGSSCVELAAATGKHKRAYPLPSSKDPQTYEWGYLALHDGMLFGTATVRKRVEERLVRRGKQTEDATDALFAFDAETGDLLWTYEGTSIQSGTIALGGDRIFFIDSSVTSEERETILRQNKSALQDLEGEDKKLAEERLKAADVRMAIALETRTGEKQWGTPVDVTDCSDIGIGGGKLTVMYKNDKLLLCGANANGHYWKQFIAGDFSRRRLVALSAANGYKLWAKDANYRHRPIIVGDEIVAEPWRFELDSGEQILRRHPLTGAKEPWSMIRPGHHCGMISAAAGMLLFRSGYTGFYDLATDSGTQHFAGHRLGCWINAIPAGGLVLIPEASAGCVCLFSIASTVALEPRPPRRPWTIYSAVGDVRPVKHMALNFGAPGDRRDAHGTLWLAYPRPAPRKETGLDLAFEVKTDFTKDGGFETVAVGEREEKDIPDWVYGFGARGLKQCQVPLLEEESAPATYTLKLFFAGSDRGNHAQPVPTELRVQGKKVTNIYVGQTESTPFSVAVEGVEVKTDLLVELSGEVEHRPRLCAVEIERR